jgi:hypothetical protein
VGVSPLGTHWSSFPWNKQIRWAPSPQNGRGLVNLAWKREIPELPPGSKNVTRGKWRRRCLCAHIKPPATSQAKPVGRPHDDFSGGRGVEVEPYRSRPLSTRPCPDGDRRSSPCSCLLKDRHVLATYSAVPAAGVSLIGESLPWPCHGLTGQLTGDGASRYKGRRKANRCTSSND